MNRFFVNPEKINNNLVTIDGEDAAHILKVLRLKEGDLIEVCDGMGTDYRGRLIKTAKGEVEVLLEDPKPSTGEPKTKVTLYQGLPKSSKMDLVIQKCVELGIYSIVPVVTARTVVNLSNPDKEHRKVMRWQKIAQEAAKQSGRGIIPKVHRPILYDEVIDKVSDPIKLLPWEEERSTGLRKALERADRAQNISILIGPEGGFEQDEIMKAKERGWKVVTLGPRILRTETAGMAVLSAIMFYMGEME